MHVLVLLVTTLARSLVPRRYSMFFASMYQLVDLWAGDLNVSFFDFLEKLFEKRGISRSRNLRRFPPMASSLML